MKGGIEIWRRHVKLRNAEGMGSSQVGVGGGMVLVISLTLILALVHGCSRIPNGGRGDAFVDTEEVFKGGYTNLVIGF